jgi:hypothetical protein
MSEEAENFIYSLKGNDGQNIITEINLTNGYVNATALCKSAGKVWNNYFQIKRTKDFLKELDLHDDKSSCPLVMSKKGGNNKGTWVHPNVAIDLANWCSPKFQVAVVLLVNKYMSGELTTEESVRVSELANEKNVLVTSFHSKPVVYIGSVECPEFTGVKIGSTDDIRTREACHKRELEKFKLIKVYDTLNNKVVERRLLDECSAKGVRKSVKIKGKSQTELVEFNENFLLENLLEIAQEITDTNTHPIIEEIEQKIKLLESDKEIEIEREKTKQMEIQEKTRQMEIELELEKIKSISKNSPDEIQETLEITPEQTSSEPCNDTHSINKFINKYYQVGTDVPTDKYRVKLSEIYELYKKNHFESFTYPPICECDFNKYMKNVLKFDKKACNWHNKTHMTWIGIRLREKPKTQIQELIEDFIETRCVLKDDCQIDTKLLYDTFEKYVIDRGYDAIKQNGISRQSFHTELFKNNKISIKQWAINGKKHAFSGIQLKNSMSINEIVKLFTEEKCVKEHGLRVKNIDLVAEFMKFIENKKYTVYSPRKYFLKAFQELNSEIVPKYVTQSDFGFIGITLK